VPSAGTSAPHLGPLSKHSGSSLLPHLVHILPSFAVGGQQIRLAQLVNRLGGEFRHTVVPLDGVTAARALIESGKNFAIEPWTAPKHRLPRPRRLWQSCAFLKNLNAAALLTYNWGAVDWALANRLWLGLPHLHFEDGFGADESAAHQLRRRVLYRRLALGGPMSRIVVPSEQLRRLATEVWRFPPGKVLHIPNGTDCDRFPAEPDPGLATRVARTRGEVIVGTVAALRPEKNLPRLLRAFAALPQATATRLVIAGDGPERKRLERLIHKLDLSEEVGLLGHVPHDQIDAHYAMADIVVLTSRSEGIPLVMMEAMAMGKVVLAPDMTGIPELVIPGQTGFLYRPGSLDDFVAKVQMIGELRPGLDAMRRAARKHVLQHFSREKNLERFADVFLARIASMAETHVHEDPLLQQI